MSDIFHWLFCFTTFLAGSLLTPLSMAFSSISLADSASCGSGLWYETGKEKLLHRVSDFPFTVTFVQDRTFPSKTCPGEGAGMRTEVSGPRYTYISERKKDVDSKYEIARLPIWTDITAIVICNTPTAKRQIFSIPHSLQGGDSTTNQTAIQSQVGNTCLTTLQIMTGFLPHAPVQSLWCTFVMMVYRPLSSIGYVAHIQCLIKAYRPDMS